MPLHNIVNILFKLLFFYELYIPYNYYNCTTPTHKIYTVMFNAKKVKTKKELYLICSAFHT